MLNNVENQICYLLVQYLFLFSLDILMLVIEKVYLVVCIG